MSIEFFGSGESLGDALADLFSDLRGTNALPKLWGDEPDPERLRQAQDLYREYADRSKDARDSEIGMLTPRITLREHTDMHAFMDMMDEFMLGVVKDWRYAVSVYAVGGTENTYEDLRERMLKILEMAAVRYAIDRLHVAWAAENVQAPWEDAVSAYPEEYEGDNSGVENNFTAE